MTNIKKEHPESELHIAETTCFKEKLGSTQFTIHIKTRLLSKFYSIQSMKIHMDKDTNHDTPPTG